MYLQYNFSFSLNLVSSPNPDSILFPYTLDIRDSKEGIFSYL